MNEYTEKIRRRWNKLPDGYYMLKFWDIIQPGDILQLNNDRYVEYIYGRFIGKTSDDRRWYRKIPETKPRKLNDVNNLVWRHVKTDTLYVTKMLTNTDSTDHERFPPTVVYCTMDGKKVWSRPMREFIEKFTYHGEFRPDSSTG